ncbi:transcriptional adapter 1 [Eurytemora carolleeae]|uniref:transcriptional adapter 1 n=1 Tax=Eurytemora carolleeae TaxID=1294199 RepID=UPI000C7598CB|nr:transcriptional adapter 1 [Eurytemora carolleeae]|eukprot:XP_023322183.1 transcriptional adapter 1-like [Eurytemora affinis]
MEQRLPSYPPSEYAPEVSDLTVHPEERKLTFCAQQGTLPDISLIHGRLLVSAWEDGIEGCEDDAVTLTMVAVQHFLKNIITSVLVSRNPWRSREGAKHSIGCPIPDPWLQNTQLNRNYLVNSSAATESTLLNEAGLAPISRPDIDKSEAEAAYQAGLGINKMPGLREPISLFDLLKVLKSDSSVIPNHSVYSLNMERIIMRLHHD